MRTFTTTRIVRVCSKEEKALCWRALFTLTSNVFEGRGSVSISFLISFWKILYDYSCLVSSKIDSFQNVKFFVRDIFSNCCGGRQWAWLLSYPSRVFRFFFGLLFHLRAMSVILNINVCNCVVFILLRLNRSLRNFYNWEARREILVDHLSLSLSLSGWHSLFPFL